METEQHSARLEPGVGCTKNMWTDRHAYTVVWVNAKGTVALVQRDHAIRTDDYGMSDVQAYRYERDFTGETATIRKRRDGRWYEAGERRPWTIGHRSEYFDYCF